MSVEELMSAEDIGILTSVVAPIDDTLPKNINIWNRVFVHENFQVPPQIIIQGVKVERHWWPLHRCLESNTVIVIRSIEILRNWS